MEPLTPSDPERIGPYELRARLGTGGMGRVYLARSRGGRPVAVKMIHAHLGEDPAFRRRLGRELEAAVAVGGFYAVDVLGGDPDGDPPWLATAYIPGPDLDAVVTEDGPFPAATVGALAAALAEALQAIHAAGLVHRDLKPSNILLAQDGPRVIDFGIVRPADGSLLTQGLIGTPAYMSPEQAAGDELGPSSDVFSLAGSCASPRPPGRRSGRVPPDRSSTGSCTASPTCAVSRPACTTWWPAAWPANRPTAPRRRTSSNSSRPRPRHRPTTGSTARTAR